MISMTIIAQAEPWSPLDVRYSTTQGAPTLQNYGLAALYTVLTSVVCLVILAIIIPLFPVAVFTGLMNGLVCQDLRKSGAGRESNYPYHKACGNIIPLMVVPWTLYLTIPIGINPLFILLPCTTLLGVAVCITASTLKKYL